MNPLISIIVPVYNTENYLKRCLESIISQTYQNLEIIIINDGSTDNSQEIIEEFARKDQRIRTIIKENGGLSSARNAGLDLATGEFISFVDSDDYLNVELYSKVMKVFKNDINIVCFPFTKIDKKGKFKLKNLELQGKYTSFDGMIFKQPWNVCNKIFRKKDITSSKIKFTENIFFEDLDFITKFYISLKPNVLYINTPFYYYCYNNNSITDKTSNKSLNYSIQHLHILDIIYKYLISKKLLEDNMYTFLKLCEYCFKSAVSNAHKCELAYCYAEMTKKLKEYNLNYKNNILLHELAEGNYKITLLKDCRTSKLKGFEKIFSVKKELGTKTLRIFGLRIFLFNKGV